jgi:mono/diheme cytochrome c family protein
MGYTPEQQAQLKEGEAIYKSLCFTCHGEDGRGAAVGGAPAPGGARPPMMGPALAGSPRVQGHRDYVIKTLLQGMTGPLAGQTFTQVMLPMGAQNDQWVATMASYIRNNFGNTASFVTASDVARVRSATTSRKTMWTFEELEATLPQMVPADASWKATASHNADRANNALTLAAWTTGVPQEPGMWLQVELPRPASISEVQFDSGLPGGRAQGRPPAVAKPGGPPIFGSYPIAYRIQVSMDGKSWSKPVAEGKGSHDTTVATFPPIQAKFVRVTQTGRADGAPAWSLLNLRIYERKTKF